MREIFSVRFFAAVAAVAGLLVLVTLVSRSQDSLPVGPATTTPAPREIDFVDWIYASTQQDFAVVDGRATIDTQLVVDGSRRLTIKQGTLGEHHCPEWGTTIGCAFVADLLGEAVVWFAIVPMGPNRTVALPAIDTLDEGIATLVNGWQMPYAPILDRICNDDYASYREFREALGENFTSVYSIDEQQLVAVQCARRVDYAPPAPASTPAPAGLARPDRESRAGSG